jgi:cytochrome c-type protein NapB
MRHLIQTTVLAALVAVSPAAGATPAPAPAPPPARPAAAAARPIPDKDLGLSRGSVFDVPVPPAWRAEASAPGDTPLPPRISREFPPVVPHGIADFLPITATQNTCLDCHAIAGPKKKGEPTPVPASHYLDQRLQPAKKGDKVAGARWVCVSCHVGRSDAPPLVKNGFRP